MTTAKRLVVGESERSGVPITAPVDSKVPPSFIGQVRWTMNGDHFELWQFTPEGWREVPVLPPFR